MYRDTLTGPISSGMSCTGWVLLSSLW